MCVRKCVCACVCVPCESVCTIVRACVRVVSRASLIFPRMRMFMRKLAEGGKNKYVFAGFCGSVVCEKYISRVHNDY